MKRGADLYNILIVKYGEIGVKGKNRYLFENKLIKNIKNMLKPLGEYNVYKEYGRIYVDVNDDNYEEVMEEVRKVFGIVGVCPGIKAEKDYDVLKETALKLIEQKIEEGAKTFKVESRRGDKSLPLTSQEMSIDIGGYILSNVKDRIKVDVRNPEVKVRCEYRELNTMVYTDSVPGYGGLPMGTAGKAMSLLSGGIDSPVATWMVAKRGMDIECIHFHTYPFTSERSREKVLDLARTLSRYCGPIKVHCCNILEIEKEITEKLNREETTIHSRRFMMMITQRLAEQRHCQAIVTGESIGQVASQTIYGLTCTNAVCSLPVFRPLIAMDKSDIIDIAQEIGTYDLSIVPEEDCCSVFAPKKPITKPKLERIEKSEEKLDIEALIEGAMATIETIVCEVE
ncbi:thiamine biosynthesis/tRNA modification protein ThiI [Peptacetobacter hiranonis DSM 13275]|uniref:Probable tRNA sulfurtransferase n=1 Tax=Peptacetobacter hiranonis (strain DSM 13275 / JCM 10541 / KCTC 15199 / TO-931) TaxID=500633 RepID=B6G144_PEPHT|nr:thiamine biosynthesis/tRNA modification protein ThiI [Peptacetobacter hiranonis DSM 13275]